ncbi:DENN domain-containing protein 2C [Sceloporus undulatus]|uniref:DENN domain-containing protein 2C n=1 Tax=Sceloporus undulatus TaxID=8520 RepID=UPI001C4BFDDD|nr:DENN domain-containing protein 2C [Sceloporus undulatus]
MHPTGSVDTNFSRSALQTLSRSHCRNIKQKISQWEGRTKGGCQEERPKPKDFGVKYGHDSRKKPTELRHSSDERGLANVQSLGLDFRENSHLCSVTEEEDERLQEGSESPRVGQLYNGFSSEGEASQDWQGERLPPGNFYTSRDLWKQIESYPSIALDLKRNWESCSSTEKTLTVTPTKSSENIYCDVEGQDEQPAINPVPKPRRTFRYHSEKDHKDGCDGEHIERKPPEHQCNGGCPPATSHDPEQRVVSRGIRGRSKRKSFEFEDIQGYRNRLAAMEYQKLHEELNGTTNVRLYCTQSEDNLYEDIIDPAKENLYEDIKVKPLWRIPSAWKLPPSRNTFNPPKLVLKIQDIFDLKRGKKRVKLVAQTGREVSLAKGETNGYDSEPENVPKSRHKRLLQVQAQSKRNPHYQTLERDLIEFQEQQLFELFVVVSLQKKPSEATYTPQIIQQFPSKPDHPFRQPKDTEERLKVIPKFCFPDPKDWFPTSELKSETFSFVLTGEDGSRWFGYCKKLLPEGKGKRLPEVYCMVSRLGCFNLFSKILDEVEKRREMSPALVHPFMRSVMEAPFPAPGRTITVKSFLPGAGNEVIELCRPLDSRLEHVDFDCLFKCLSVSHLIQVCASLLLERRVIFVADNLSTLSKCGHAVVAALYPFTWQHTYIPVLPTSMIDIVCSPTPFLIGILSCSLTQLQDLPIEEVLIVDLCGDKFLQQVSDEDEILPHKLQSALIQILEERNEILFHERSYTQGDVTLDSLVSEAFVRFFVEIVGHYSLHMHVTDKGERVFQREPFRKSHTSRNVRHFLEIFMETQMFAGFIQDRELRKSGVKGLFEVRALEYLETIPESEPSGMNKILRSLGSKMKFLQKK